MNRDTQIFIYPYLPAYIKTIRASVLIRVGRCVVATDGDAIALFHPTDRKCDRSDNEQPTPESFLIAKKPKCHYV